jgi:hypothetical protein
LWQCHSAAEGRAEVSFHVIIGEKREWEFYVLFAPAQVGAGIPSGVDGILDQSAGVGAAIEILFLAALRRKSSALKSLMPHAA